MHLGPPLLSGAVSDAPPALCCALQRRMCKEKPKALPRSNLCLWCGDLSAESHAEQVSETKMAATLTRGAVSLMTTGEHS